MNGAVYRARLAAYGRGYGSVRFYPLQTLWALPTKARAWGRLVSSRCEGLQIVRAKLDHAIGRCGDFVPSACKIPKGL